MSLGETPTGDVPSPWMSPELSLREWAGREGLPESCDERVEGGAREGETADVSMVIVGARSRRTGDGVGGGGSCLVLFSSLIVGVMCVDARCSPLSQSSSSSM